MSIPDTASRALTFRFNVDAAESVRAGREVERARGGRWFALAVWPVLALMTATYLATGTPLRDLSLPGVAALILAVHSGAPLVRRWQLRRLYAGTPSLSVPQVYTFSEAGVVITGGPSSTLLG